MDFHAVADAVEGIPFLERWHARRIYDHLRAVGARDVLELGTAHGVSAAYMAAAVEENGGGRVTTIDREQYSWFDPGPEEVLERAGLRELVEVVRIPHSSYTWWLKQVIERRTDDQGVCDPAFDFCLIDGAHDWHVDGLAAVLVERLLRPGAWVLFDDLDWNYERDPGMGVWDLSPEERRTPHVQEVFDHIVRPNPAFREFIQQDHQWGWARKAALGETGARVETIEVTRKTRSLQMQRLERAARRATRRLRTALGLPARW